mgnify:CR=1 FL=1
MNTAIDVKQLSVTLGNRHILHDINVSVPIGKITTLIGPNGCGKSTLLRSMIGYISSPSECVTIFDKPLSSYSQNKLARQMAFLPQVPNMPKDMTVEELVYCGRYPYQTWWKNTAKEDREIVDYALDITKTNHLREQLIPSLSGGERQRVWIAMALAQKTPYLLLDEPTTYLDIRYQLELLRLLKEINQKYKITIIMVLHDINQAIQYSDNIIAIKKGRIIVEGKSNEVITSEVIREIYGIDLKMTQLSKQPYVFTV